MATRQRNVVVKCYPLSSLMNTLGQTHIDYFSLDVEGAEMIILQSIDWKHLDIDVFTIETDQHRQDILTLLKTHRYRWIQIISGDDVFWKIKEKKKYTPFYHQTRTNTLKDSFIFICLWSLQDSSN